jgi:hypothetical protein
MAFKSFKEFKTFNPHLFLPRVAGEMKEGAGTIGTT